MRIWNCPERLIHAAQEKIMQEKMTSGNVLNPEISFPHALLISASAGSGKTYTLAQRYAMFLLGEGRHNALPMNPENIIAVTFTNNAAKEMKQRILLYLKNLALGKNDDAKKISAALNIPEEGLKCLAAEKVSSLLDSYSDFQVQTIDSFFSGIFRLSASELNYSPDIETRFSSDAITDMGISAVIATAGGPGILDEQGTDNFLSLIPKKDSFLWNPAEGMKKAFSDFLSMESSMPFSLEVPEVSEDDTDNIFIEAVREYSRILSKVPKEFVRPQLRSVGLISSPLDFINKFSSGTFSFFDGKKKNRIMREVPRAMEYADIMDNFAERLAKSYSLSYYKTYMEIYGLFRDKTEYIKRKITNSIPISDISKHLANYISTAVVPEIYYNLGSRLNHFMIDEFQDTNRLQWNVMLPLIEEALSSRGSLFLVGDIKQAIYRFRHADYKIMSSLMHSSEDSSHGLSTGMLGTKGIECENLPVNYRSGGAITDYAEKVFKQELPGLLSHYGIEDCTGLTEYSQQAKAENRGKGYVLCRVIDPESDEGKNYKSIITAWVKDAMTRHSCNEIALLVSRNDEVEEMAALLSSENIPSASFSSLDIRKRPIIAEIISLLKFLDKPYDDLAFFSFINGSVFAKSAMPQGCNLASALSARQRGELLYAFFRNSAVFAECWKKYFDPLFRKSGYLPLYELICHIYDSFSVFDNFPDEHAALAKFQQAAASAAGRGINTVGDFLDYASADEPDEDSKKEFAVAMPDNLEAVQVMTWHKSKGLGFPVVINVISANNRKAGKNLYFYQNNRKIYPLYNSSNLKKLSGSLNKQIFEDSKDELTQSLNTMYVICTRAKQELYNLVLRKTSTDSKEKELPSFADIFFPYEAGNKAEGRHLADKPAAARLNVRSRTKERSINFNSSPVSYDGNDGIKQSRGELLHSVIEEYAKKPYSGISGRRNMLSDIYDSFYGFYFSAKNVISKKDDLELLEKFLDNPSVKPFFAENAGAHTLMEAEFIDSDGNLIRIDMVKILPEYVIAADFKTGSRHAEKYRRQLLHYMKTLEQAYGLPAKGYVLYIDPPHVEEIKAKQ